MPNDEPAAADIERVRTWEGDWLALLVFMESIWPDYGTVRKRFDGSWEFVTGGWSGCEAIIAALMGNYIAWTMLWQSSHRGGLHIFKPPSS